MSGDGKRPVLERLSWIAGILSALIAAIGIPAAIKGCNSPSELTQQPPAVERTPLAKQPVAPLAAGEANGVPPASPSGDSTKPPAATAPPTTNPPPEKKAARTHQQAQAIIAAAFDGSYGVESHDSSRMFTDDGSTGPTRILIHKKLEFSADTAHFHQTRQEQSLSDRWRTVADSADSYNPKKLTTHDECTVPIKSMKPAYVSQKEFMLDCYGSSCWKCTSTEIKSWVPGEVTKTSSSSLQRLVLKDQEQEARVLDSLNQLITAAVESK